MKTSMLILWGGAAPILIGASIADLRWRCIPNGLVLALAVVALLRVASHFDVVGAMYDFGVALSIFVLLAILWRQNLLGGGDVKLAAVASLLVGHRAVPDFLLSTTIFGGVLALFALVDARIAKSFGWSIGLGVPAGGADATSSSGPSVPYGIAIAAGCVATLFLSLAMR